MNNLPRYISLSATVAIARITIAQLGIVFPKTMGPPAEALSWIVLIVIGIAVLLGVLNVWQEAPNKLSLNDFVGIAGLAAGAIILDLALKGLGRWLAV